MAGERDAPPLLGLTARLGTVRVRTTLIATAAVAVALIAGSYVLISLLSSQLTDTVRLNAQSRADELATALTESAPTALSLPDDDDRLVQVVDSQGRVIRASSADLGTTPLSDVAPGESETIHVPFDDEGYLAVATQAQSAHGVYAVVVAYTLDRVDESRRALTRLLGIGLPILLLVLAATTWQVVGRALAPVEAIRAEVDEVSATELHRRVPQPPGDDEVARLAATMNRMLARLEAARLRQQQFVSDASHELRSPMASIRAHAEVAMAHPDRGTTAELAETVLAESMRVQQLVENLLVLARADEQSAAPVHVAVDLDDLVFGEAQRLRATSSVVLDTTCVSAGRVVGDAALLRSLVGNLLGNAVRHARSRIDVLLQETGESVLFRVDDDGAGVPSQSREVVFARFSRLDDARTPGDAGGAGLGLAIVAEVVAGHGGTVTMSESSNGGARLDVRLPRATN